ncbi:MAG: hypothetical protein NUW01_01280 [Gemmatimonadaceae bacterium]|nr:hypothetical protein [Gemmatimonadaceae bacterium]
MISRRALFAALAGVPLAAPFAAKAVAAREATEFGIGMVITPEELKDAIERGCADTEVGKYFHWLLFSAGYVAQKRNLTFARSVNQPAEYDDPAIVVKVEFAGYPEKPK